MYKSFYRLKEKPFQIIPDPSYLYLSPNHNRALKYLEYGISENIGIILLSGEVGSGKTTLLKYIKQQIGQNLDVIVISNTNLSANQLLEYILLELSIEPDKKSKARNLTLFRDYLRSIEAENRRVILILDEAQNLPKDALEEVRMLSNFQSDDRLPVQICLVGQPELRTILNSPGMHQIRQRIAVNYHLDGLDQEDTNNYISYRLDKAGSTRNPFSPDAVKLIFEATSGIPRSINIVCDSLLLYGFAEEVETIDAVIAKSVINELNLSAFVKKETRDYRVPDNLSTNMNNNSYNDCSPAENYLSDLARGSLASFKKQLDRIELKMDLLVSELLKTTIDSLMNERLRCEDLKFSNEKIRDNYEKLKALNDRTDRTDSDSCSRISLKEASAVDIPEAH
jgi:type II secretory pathway predicted ATPase ExeA